jgi:ribosome-associated protein
MSQKNLAYRRLRDNGDRGADAQKPSRSAQKRRSHVLQDMGMRLTRLAPRALALLDLPPELQEAVLQYPLMRSHEARRRQMQYIGRLMRELNENALKRCSVLFNIPE